MHGFVSLEAAGGFALPQDLDESYRRLVDGFAQSPGPTRRDVDPAEASRSADRDRLLHVKPVLEPAGLARSATVCAGPGGRSAPTAAA